MFNTLRKWFGNQTRHPTAAPTIKAEPSDHERGIPPYVERRLLNLEGLLEFFIKNNFQRIAFREWDRAILIDAKVFLTIQFNEVTVFQSTTTEDGVEEITRHTGSYTVEKPDFEDTFRKLKDIPNGTYIQMRQIVGGVYADLRTAKMMAFKLASCYCELTSKT